MHLLPPVVAFQNDMAASFRVETISVLFEAACGCPSRKIPEMFYQHASCQQLWNVFLKQPCSDTRIVEIIVIILNPIKKLCCKVSLRLGKLAKIK